LPMKHLPQSHGILYSFRRQYLLIIHIYCRLCIKNLWDEFCNTRSILQGWPMPPTLFKIYIHTALEEWSRKCKVMGLTI
jgi:hypothetical protein